MTAELDHHTDGRSETGRRALSAVWLSLRLSVLGISLTLIVAWKVFDYVPLVVETGSMSPTIPVGTIIFVKGEDPANVDVGDIITFDPPGPQGRTTHRVHELEQRDGDIYFVTKGDANPTPDDWRRSAEQDRPSDPDKEYDRGVTYGDGKVPTYRTGIPYIGHVWVVASRGWFRIALIATPLLILVARCLAWIWLPRTRGDAAAEWLPAPHDPPPPHPIEDDHEWAA